MNFGQAIEVMKTGQRVEREGWNGKDMWITIQFPDEHSKMTQPYIYIKTVQGDLLPWVTSQADVLAEDWLVTE